MKNNNKGALIGVPVLIVAALLFGLLLGSQLPTHDRISPRQAEIPGVGKLAEVMELLRDNYVDPISPDSLIEDILPEMLKNLDPHTVYISGEDIDDANTEIEGSFFGIGISYQLMNDTITILEIISGGPSERVGLMAGDRIIEIDDSVMVEKGLSANDVVKLLRGPEGTKVKVGIKRNGTPDLLSYEIIRGEIPINSIDASYMITPTTGYIKVNTFSRNTFDEFLTAMILLKSSGAENFILDLRGNGGGLLGTAIAMANEFLQAADAIVETRGRNEITNDLVFANGLGSCKRGQLVVLIDEFSASASEIVAGAIQDNDRGLIIGRRSFGKGLVQIQETLSDSSALRITTQRYYTPSGRCIQKPFTKGNFDNYDLEILDRYNSGEAFSADSAKFDKSQIFYTAAGRTVYGGGGIMPDKFVPADTSNLTGWYTQVVNAGLLHKFAFKYADENRTRLDQASSSSEILTLLPSDGALLSEFVRYAADNGIAARWYYINISRPLLLTNIKALIARDILGSAAFYEIHNTSDNVVAEALRAIADGSASCIANEQAGNTQRD
ncbi:MAG: PDZ domain-containing protein [Bacteroidales bacterium]|nr:PDZ domain-containing protein [Bacteroidales bacterium]